MHNRWGIFWANVATPRSLDLLALDTGLHCYVIMPEAASRIPEIRERYPQAYIEMRHSTPNWPGTDPKEWAASVKKFYDAHGNQVNGWAFMNEPDIEPGFPGWGQPIKDQIWAAAQWARICAQELKRLIPSIRLHAPAMAWEDRGYGWAWFMETWKPVYQICDVVNSHNYWEEGGHYCPNCLYDPEKAKHHAFRYRQLREWLLKYGINKPIFIEECGNFGPDKLTYWEEAAYYFRALEDDAAFVIGGCLFILRSNAGNWVNDISRRQPNTERFFRKLGEQEKKALPYPTLEQKEVDYVGAVWRRGVPFYNYRKGPAKKDTLIIHSSVGSFRSTVLWFLNPLSRVSANYVVGRGHAGIPKIYQMVRERDVAYHVGPAWNERAIGVEFVDDGLDWYPKIQTDYGIALCKDIVARNEIVPERVWFHRELMTQKRDPVGMDKERFMRALFGGENPESKIRVAVRASWRIADSPIVGKEELPLEEYLLDVVPRELGSSFNPPLEALKAQAAAARSYALTAMSRPKHGDAHICNSAHCQVWAKGARYPLSDQAVRETKGVDIRYKDQLIEAFYSSNCGGRTINSEDRGWRPLPYCRSVSCPVGGTVAGHRVGLCQLGAMEMARQGKVAREILEHYYTGITVNLPEPTPAPKPEPEPEPSPYPDEGLYKAAPGFGIHAGLDMSERKLKEDYARCADLGIKWVVLVPTDEIQLEKAIKIFWPQFVPVVRPYALIDGHHDFVRDARIMLIHDVPPYIQIYNEPGDHREWKSGRPNYPLFVARWVDAMEAVANAGGWPGLQVLDTDLLREVIKETRRRGIVHLWERAWFCLHNYGLNHPPKYPYDDVNQKGIPVVHPSWKFVASIEQINEWREKDKNPGQTIHQDYNGVLGFLAFAKVFEEELGFVPPMIAGEGGWQYGSSQDRRYPIVDEYLHARYHAGMYAWFKTKRLPNGDPLPEYLWAICPWILSGESDAWFGGPLGTKDETIRMVKEVTLG